MRGSKYVNIGPRRFRPPGRIARLQLRVAAAYPSLRVRGDVGPTNMKTRSAGTKRQDATWKDPYKCTNLSVKLV